MNRMLFVVLLLGFFSLALLDTGCQEAKTTFGTVPADKDKDKK
jgi:hypothetical protein